VGREFGDLRHLRQVQSARVMFMLCPGDVCCPQRCLPQTEVLPPVLAYTYNLGVKSSFICGD